MEAIELLEKGAAFSIKDSAELKLRMNLLLKEENRLISGTAARQYVQNHTGATQKFLDIIYNKGIF
jgi:3-deoxy-D-manno-octulosonic-acid transferase